MEFAGFVCGSYTAQSVNIAAEECINFYAETNETAGAQAAKSYIGTPGLVVFSALPEAPERGSCIAGARLFAVGGTRFYEVAADGTTTDLGNIGSDGKPASIVASNTQLLIVSTGHAYCLDLTTDALTDVTGLLAAVPQKAEYSDGYFIVKFENSNKFQVSALFDGLTWPGLQVNEVSVFPENISSIIVTQRQLWIFGDRHIQVYQNTGSDQIFDPIPGAFIENGCAATFGPCRADNTILWVNEDERGGRVAWRASGYTPQRISTHAVETALQSYPSIADLVTYAYQESGHLFWALYIPNTDCSWNFDVAENLWHKRAEWHADTATFGPHRSWNHVYAFNKCLVGDWNSANLYQMSLSFYDDNGETIRRVRQSPTVNVEQRRLFYSELRVDFDTGLGPQPPLEDGDGNPRPPQAMLQWSNDGGHTWGNEHLRDCGFAGEYATFVRWQRLGYARRRVFRLAVSDPIQWTITTASLDVE